MIFLYFSDVYMSGKSYKNFKYFYQAQFVYFYIVNELYVSGLLLYEVCLKSIETLFTGRVVHALEKKAFFEIEN